jgi:hypothetical protein
MRRHIARFAVAVAVLGVATVAAAQVAVESGTVVRIDPQSSVVMLDDGRMFRITPQTVVMIDNRPAPLPALRPGERIVIQSGEPVAYRDGRYIALPAAAPSVVAQAPAVAVPSAVAVPAGVKQTVYGTVTDVDRDGQVTIKVGGDEFDARLSRQAASQLRKGDQVVIDMTFTAPGSPSAFPR